MIRVLSQLNRRLGRVSSLFLLLCAFVFVTPPATAAAARERDWQPQRTWVFVVGALRFKHEEMFDSFPQENRRDAELVAFFRQQGVPAPQIVYLRDREATAKRIESAFAEQLGRAREGDWLFLYYTGHGYRPEDDDDAYLASYDAGDEDVPGWPVKSIPASIERYFKGSRAFLTLDNCYSGALVEAVRALPSRISYAVLTSATANQVSTAEWTFTEGLLAALRGKAYEDSNNDGDVTLGEMAEQVTADMSFAERQRAVFATTGDFSPQTVLSRAERKTDTRVGERVVVRSDGDWFKGRIIDVDQEDSEFLIHYYGWDDSYDEWVDPEQIRRPRATRATFGRKRLEGSRSNNSFRPQP